MKLSFNEATTLKNSNLEKDLELCEKLGYDYIEIRAEDKLPEYLQHHSIEDLADYFRTRHIKPLALNALVFSITGMKKAMKRSSTNLKICWKRERK